jgi:abequosyltransferase
MNNITPIISFCIPTYNREKYLARSIDAIVSQLTNQLKYRVELVVSDNGSTDLTKKIVEDYILSRPDHKIRLVSNTINIGMDGNFLNCFRNAKGKFVCLVSDDDFLLPGSVQKLFDILTLHPNVSGIFLNSFEMKGGPSEVEGICYDSNEAIQRVGPRIFHLSGLLINREIFSKKNYENFDGCVIVQSYVYLDAIMDGDGIYFPSQKFFEITENNSSGGYSFFVVFVTNFCDLMSYALRIGFSYSAVKKVKLQHLKYFLIPFIVDFRLNNSHINVTKHFREGFRLIVNKYGLIPLVLLGAAPAVFAPKFFWVFIRSVVRLIRRISLWNAVKGVN